MRCIRCGADVALNPSQHMYLTAGGGYVCPSSLPGEAAIHRVTTAPPARPKSQIKEGVKRAAWNVGTALLAFKSAEFITKGHHNFGPPRQYYDPSLDGSQAGDVMGLANEIENRRRYGA